LADVMLETIEIPASLTSIGNDAFKKCAKLRSIRCYANSSTWQPRYICDSNTTVYYSYNPNHTHSYKSHVIKMSGCTLLSMAANLVAVLVLTLAQTNLLKILPLPAVMAAALLR
jgi:hypothetical protein